MSENLVESLLERRAGLERQVLSQQADIFHIDDVLTAIERQNMAPAPRKQTRYFANGELTERVGQAERAGNVTATPIVLHVMKAKGMDPTDAALRKRILQSVKECRKRLSGRG